MRTGPLLHRRTGHLHTGSTSHWSCAHTVGRWTCTQSHLRRCWRDPHTQCSRSSCRLGCIQGTCSGSLNSHQAHSHRDAPQMKVDMFGIQTLKVQYTHWMCSHHGILHSCRSVCWFCSSKGICRTSETLETHCQLSSLLLGQCRNSTKCQCYGTGIKMR